MPSHRIAHVRWPQAAAASLLALALTAQAQTPAASAPTRHRILTGDTLEQLSRHYLGDGSLWPALQRHNQVGSPYRLQPGSVLEIPYHLQRLASASVSFLQGNATLLPPPSRSSQAAETPLRPGQDLPEGSRLRVPPDAFVSVRLADGTLLQVQADSEILLQQLRRKGRAGSLQSVVDLQRGALDAAVPPHKGRPPALDVRTNVATSSVRGTEFGVYLAEDGSTVTTVQRGVVQVQSALTANANARLPKGQGAAVDRSGQLQQAALLPALPASQLPQLAEDAQWLDLPLPSQPTAAGYVVQVSEDAAGRQVLRNGRFAGDTVRFPAVPDGSYFLQVRAVDGHGIPGLPAQGLLKVKAHPVPPLYQTPPAAVLPSDAVALHCTPVHGATAYRIQIAATGQDFAAPLRDEVLNTCALETETLPRGEYRWRTASIRTLDNGQPDQGPFAAAQDFRAAERPPVPDAAALAWNTAGGLPTMHWQGEPGQSWRIVVAREPEALQPLLDTRVEQPQWEASELGPGRYYLRLQARDASGLESALSAAREFTLRPWVRDGFGRPLRSGNGLDVITE
ncbi:FecR domain-containing protein [Comamonas sp. GB3 AK4-5]|uniref:FecR domain-containing protein n=1 Tax=Comamonas sp. GB3 AK4-5 TaxID=3231487 RepID=UPI00351EF935